MLKDTQTGRGIDKETNSPDDFFRGKRRYQSPTVLAIGKAAMVIAGSAGGSVDDLTHAPRN